jgi:hypothetical protein
MNLLFSWFIIKSELHEMLHEVAWTLTSAVQVNFSRFITQTLWQSLDNLFRNDWKFNPLCEKKVYSPTLHLYSPASEALMLSKTREVEGLPAMSM